VEDDTANGSINKISWYNPKPYLCLQRLLLAGKLLERGLSSLDLCLRSI